MSPLNARKRLARIRCLLEAVDAIRNHKALPWELCFVPEEIDFVISEEALQGSSAAIKFPVWSRPTSLGGKLMGRLNITEDVKDYVLTVFGDEFADDEGEWARLTPATLKKHPEAMFIEAGSEAWVLLFSREPQADKPPQLIAKHEAKEVKGEGDTLSKQDLFGGALLNLAAQGPQKRSDTKGHKNVYKWQQVVESAYLLTVAPRNAPTNASERLITRMREPPTAAWTIEADEELVRFLNENNTKLTDFSGGCSKFVSQILVSTEQEQASNLMDGDPTTFWESDGSLGKHYIRLHMKPGIIIQKLSVGVDGTDDNYMPTKVVVYATAEGSSSSKMLRETPIDCNAAGDIVILENCSEFHPTIEIRIKECKDDGIDCRIHGVKILNSKQKQIGLSRSIFNKDLVRFPKLESVRLKDRDVLYNRAKVLMRFSTLLDSVIHFLLPTWEYTTGTFKCLEIIRQLLPLSQKRQILIEGCLTKSQGSVPSNVPKIFMNRHLAAEHLVDPTIDPSAKNTIFNQLYLALMLSDEPTLDFRWPLKYDQWWEVKFIGEGIIDQGGGFRDSISDIAEELNPSASDTSIPLPFFVRSPNQMSTSSVNRDCYVPNSECREFAKYEWLGMFMGGCLRGKENLVLSLPPFFWKFLNGEMIVWEKDYHTIDAAEVKLHEEVRAMTEEEFNTNFSNYLSYMTTMCSGKEIPVKEGGANETVLYEDRLTYLQLVQGIRMNEFKSQMEAIRAGLEKVVPRAVLTLLTWQELEHRICGDPEIPVSALKQTAHFDDFEENDVSLKYFWQALENFTNEDRSRFLRFVTGRRRLPTPLFISRAKSSAALNSLPESATCSHTLFLPRYSSAVVCEEKLRYAAYTCIAIDTDMSPWEE